MQEERAAREAAEAEIVAAAVEVEEEAAALRRSMAAKAQVAGSFGLHFPTSSHLLPLKLSHKIVMGGVLRKIMLFIEPC